jgi:hypothetical protein
MFVIKGFQLVKSFLVTLHLSASKKHSHMYSMTSKIFISFSTYEYKKYSEFNADFKSVG